MMAALCGRQKGYCKGKAGSVRIADFGIGKLGANGRAASRTAVSRSPRPERGSFFHTAG
jgi:TPP-dependent pyruvate/acetoin dehydrogenase alpha subunit